jgi:hypothetical protein
MNLDEARHQIQNCLEGMRALYTRPVFDEWIIVGSEANSRGGVLAYSGPRPETFRAELRADVQPLVNEASGREMSPGDFEFTASGPGTRHDAMLKIGPHGFLLCNNTLKSMAEIRSDSLWLKAQPMFFQLSEKFRADPLLSS